MPSFRSVFFIALFVLVCTAAFGQSQPISVVNYVPAGQAGFQFSYRVEVVNNGPSLPAMTATVVSLDPYSLRVMPEADTLQFDALPANARSTSTTAFTVYALGGGSFDPSKVQVVFNFPAGAPTANAGPNQTAAVGSTVTLNGSASTNPIGSGMLNYRWNFVSRPPGSAAVLSQPAAVFSTFVVDVPGTYIVSLAVSNGVGSSTANVTVSTGQTPPVANAGPNQTLSLGATAVLNGSGSTSVDGRPLAYAWTLITRPSGSSATLNAANTVSPSFVIDKAGTYVAQLIVNDGLPSKPATVTISMRNTAPVANAGPSQVVNTGAQVQLNGAGSTDANGLPLTYQWSLIAVPSGSSAALNNPTLVNPTFTADRQGTYVAQLIVNNGAANSDPATVTITTQAPLAPTANAGPNQTVAMGATVTLNGTGTDPNNRPLTYQWSLIAKPAGSAAALSSATIANPSFTADAAGSYVAQLIVNNGLVSSAPSTVTISTSCAQPVANPGSNQTVNVGASVTLDGSGSGDVCRDPLTYSWSFTTRPQGSGATLSGAATASPSFTPDVSGAYVVQLIVNNGFTNSNPATVVITAASTAPPPPSAAIVLPANVSVGPNQTAPFPVSLASPAPGGGVFISLSSSDPDKVSIAPANIYIPQGTTSANRAPNVTGLNSGSATITASAYGLPSASQVVQVTSNASLSFSPPSVTISGTSTQILTLTLAGTITQGGVIALTSSNPGVATVPANVNYGAGASSVNVPVTGVAAGSTTITATSAFGSAVASVTVSFSQAAILLPANVTVAPGDTAPFAVTLGTAAPSGGVFITLGSSDTSKATIAPTTVFVAQGSTAPSRAPAITGVAAGSALITASAYGLTSASQLVQVSGGATLSFSPAALTINAGATQSLTLMLSAPAPAGGLTVTLASNNPGVASAPNSVSIAPYTNSVAVAVTGVAAGSATLNASATGFGAASATITVSAAAPGIVLPSNLTVSPGQSLPFQVTLGSPAPSGGIFLTLSTSDTSRATVAPSSILIPQGTTTPSRAPVLTGVSPGTALLTVSASGLVTASQLVQVTGSGGSSGGTMSFSPSVLSMNGTGTQNLTLSLSAPAPAGGLTIALTSSNTGVGAVPPSMNLGANATSATVPVTGIAPGSATITATAPNFGSASATLTVAQPAAINIATNLSVIVGQSAALPVTLSTPAPGTGVTVALVSSDPAKAAVTPSVFVPGGATSPSTQAAVNGFSAGAVTITATAPGYAQGSGVLQVVVGGGSSLLSPSNLSINAGSSQTLTLSLSSPASAGLTASLSSSNPAVATVAPQVSFVTGASNASITVNGLSQGSSTITAATPGFGSSAATATVTANTTTPAITVPATLNVAPGQSTPLPISLGTGAPAGGVLLTLTSSDTSRATVTSAVAVPQGAIAPTVPPQVNGVSAGSALITVSAPGYTPANAQVQVGGGGGSSYFSPSTLAVYGTGTQSLILFLSASAPTGATINLRSSDTRIATVPDRVDVVPAYSSAIIPVTGVSPGTATITATSAMFGTATAVVTVTAISSVQVTWYGGCWQQATLYGVTGRFQAMDFALSTPVPVPVQASLFFGPNCDPALGFDNMNDYGSLTSSTHTIQGFSHFPDRIPTSALFWIGVRTANGLCPPGAPCSMCVNYTETTPDCSTMP